MKGLRCTTANCEYNTCERCQAGIIDVSRGAVCRSKTKREGGALAQVFAGYEAASAYPMEDPELIVQCDADCIYNSNSLCTREHVNIADGVMRTRCVSRKRS
jgi:hypothetical protein